MNIAIFCLLLINIGWTISLYFLSDHGTIYNYLYNLSYGLNFILGSYFSASYFRQYPLYRNSLKYFFLAFTSFSLAQFVWLHYNVISHTAVPYPGIADIFWVLFYPLIALGFVRLLKQLGSPLSIVNLVEISFTSCVIYLLLSSFLDIQTTQIGLPVLTQILNYTYPIADAILIGLCIITLRSQIGHLNPQLLYFIFGFATLALGDTLFSYQTTIETYWNGNIADLCYAISGYFILMGTISLNKLFQPTQIIT